MEVNIGGVAVDDRVWMSSPHFVSMSGVMAVFRLSSQSKRKINKHCGWIRVNVYCRRYCSVDFCCR